MVRDIINAPALECAVDNALEAIPRNLQSRQHELRAYFCRAATGHDSVHQARRRKSDPGWALSKFDGGRTLYRFIDQEGDTLIDAIRELLEELSDVEKIAANRQLPIAREAEALLRGIPHRKDDMRSFGRAVWNVIRRAQTAALRARSHEVLRSSAELADGNFIGIMCVSLNDIVRLGREARNCLADSEQYWERFIAGKVDIWSLRGPSGLIAVLEIEGTRVTEILGPKNTTLAVEQAHRVACFCDHVGWIIDQNCEGILSEFAGPVVVSPRHIVIGKRVAVYAEWKNAVRIDVSNKAKHNAFASRFGDENTLVLAFDSERPCADEIINGSDPRKAIKRFGTKKLRKIMREVALGHVDPTLVQHRLLALAA